MNQSVAEALWIKNTVDNYIPGFLFEWSVRNNKSSKFINPYINTLTISKTLN
jgi:hypothetical protein